MPFLTADIISSLTVELLVRSLVLPRTVLTVPGREVAGPAGGKVTIRIPVPRTARVQTTPGATITVDPVTENQAEITVRHIYDATRITDEDLTLNLENFARQVLMPQVAAVAVGAEDELVALFNSLPADLSFPADPATLDDDAFLRAYEDKILEAGEILDNANVPAGNRYMAVSPSVARRLLRIDKFTRVDASGERTALRQAIIGSLYGFEFVKSNALTAGTAVAYHESAFAFCALPPAAPGGEVSSATANRDGVSVRHIMQYNPSTLSVESVVSVFAGAAVIDADRCVKFDTAES